MYDFAAWIKPPAPTDTAAADYWHESARPLTSLIFVLPLLVTYELGVIVLGPHAMRNGADAWLRLLLDHLGFGQYFILPVITCFTLYAWHHLSRREGTVHHRTFALMIVECAFLAFILLSLARLQFRVLGSIAITALPTPPTMATSTGVIGFLGAGIYEELLFRLMMLPVIAGALRFFGESSRVSMITAIFTSSLLFSAAHYESFIGYGEPLELTSFAFRCSAGIFFCLLFVYRGFGVAVGVHTLYDIYAGMIST